MAKARRYVWRWNDGGVVVDKTWAYDRATVWDNATRVCRPASLRDATDEVVQDYLKEHGEVVEYE